ncbi:MAG: acyl-CoA thioesterase [Frankiaceae bacterium]|nr:acyl-CoA thioesterase [Frankiaceae bacterium]
MLTSLAAMDRPPRATLTAVPDDHTDLARRCAEAMYVKDIASQTLGITIDAVGPGTARATMAVRVDMLNGHGICHGGYVFTLADTAFAFACNSYDDVTVAAGADVTFLAPVEAGTTLIATATERARRGRSGLYDVAVATEAGDVVAEFRGRSRSLGRPLL